MTDGGVASPFPSSVEHLLAELERVDLLIRLQLGRMRRAQPAGSDPFQGLYITDEEVSRLVERPAGLPRWLDGPADEADGPTVELLARLSASLRARAEASMRAGVPLRLVGLAARFGLSPGEMALLLVALAPEIDLRYERLYAFLQDDVTRRRPSVEMALSLLWPGLAERLEARRLLEPAAPLLRRRLLSYARDTADAPLGSRALMVEPRVVDHLLGRDRPHRAIEDYLKPHAQPRRLADLLLPPDLQGRLTALGEAGGGGVLLLQGPYGIGKRAVAGALCRAWGAGLLEVDGASLAAASRDAAGFDESVALIMREAALTGALPYWGGFDSLLPDDKRPLLDSLLRALEARGGAAFLGGDAAWDPQGRLAGIPFVRIVLPRPDSAARLSLWREALAAEEASLPEEEMALVAGAFRFTGGEIRDAAATARDLARWRDPASPQAQPADMREACRLHSSRNLSSLGQKIEPRYRWDDIVLSADRMEQLREVTNAVRFRALVHEKWGFGAKLSGGKSVAVLFAGPSGTGKTMAAEVIAGELGLDLYKIDLSAVVSKFIGETEKNLSRIFAEAEASNAILFFDEADALFGKRSEVRDAHDRYANIETAYLLQRVEAYEGLIVLATNLKKNMDDAFVRRLSATIEFIPPAEPDRRRIWSGIWPKATPLAEDVDLDLLAKRFDLSGGNIKNVALAAAFLAAADGGQVTMGHLMQATGREFQKMGKIITGGEMRL